VCTRRGATCPRGEAARVVEYEALAVTIASLDLTNPETITRASLK